MISHKPSERQVAPFRAIEIALPASCSWALHSALAWALGCRWPA